MGGRNPVSADDLENAVSVVVTALQPASRLEWSVPAGSLEWSCAQTADHLGRCLVAYASQLAVRPDDRYVGFTALADDDATPAQLLEFVQAGGRMLAAMVRTSPAAVRAFHPFGTADPEGFAGMGCVEILIHGHDIANGFGLLLEPPPDLCARVLERMFPDAPAGSPDPWTALRIATGRAVIDGRPAVTAWQWRGAPPEA
jgi:hypothetical protein